MEPVLNERSLEPAAVPALERAISLSAVLKKLNALGFPRVLRHTRDALEREIEPGVSFKAWLFQKAPPDLKRFLAGPLQRAPFVTDLLKRQEDDRGALLEASCDGVPAHGASLAYLHDAPAVALRGTPRWEVDPLSVLFRAVDEDGRLTEKVVGVIHLWRPEQVDAREKLLRERVLRAVSGGDELWRRRCDLFPRLDFCETVEPQVRGLTGHEFFFQRVVLALACLDAALAQWTAGPLHPGMDHSSESNSTLNHGTYGPMRDFPCPDQQTRRFKNHLKLFSNNWRIYYLETRSAAGGRAFVGYVGAHLPTVLYPT